MQKCQAGPPFPPSSSAPALQLQLTWALVVACSGFLSSRSRMKRGKRRDIPFSLSTWGPQGDQTCLSEPRPQGKPMGGGHATRSSHYKKMPSSHRLHPKPRGSISHQGYPTPQ